MDLGLILFLPPTIRGRFLVSNASVVVYGYQIIEVSRDFCFGALWGPILNHLTYSPRQLWDLATLLHALWPTLGSFVEMRLRLLIRLLGTVAVINCWLICFTVMFMFILGCSCFVVWFCFGNVAPTAVVEVVHICCCCCLNGLGPTILWD